MNYHVMDPAGMESTSDYPCDRRSITETVGLDQLNVAIYELAPGEDLARSYHYHERREETFYVLSGSLHVETPDRDYVVERGEVFVAEPESPLRPYNPSDSAGPVSVLGAGAPLYDVARTYDP